MYKKHQDPLKVVRDQGRPDLLHEGITKLLTKREIYTCELLREHRHPNIAKYRGVICKDVIEFGKGSSSKRINLGTERVYKLAFKRYDGDLQDLVHTRKRSDVKYCLRSIEAGILHMHSLGLCHMDIKPENIFVENLRAKHSSRWHEFVIGDFDSTAPIGSSLSMKGGDLRWSNPRRNETGRTIKADNH